MNNSYNKLALLPILLVSCQSESDQENTFMNEVREIHVSVENMEEDLNTRAYPFVSDFDIRFFNTDTLGIFSLKDGKQQTYQMTFPVLAADGQAVKSFNFTGGGWYMSEEYQYQAYCPYNYDNRDATKLPLLYVGQKQIGNNNMDNLSPYFFVTSEASSPTNHKLSLSLTSRNNIARYILPAPAVASYKKLYLCAEEEVFAAKSTYNLEESSFGIPSKKTKATSLSLENISATSVGQELTLFMIVCPIDLTGKTLKIVLEDTNGNKYVSAYNGKQNFKSNGMKSFLAADLAGFHLDNGFIIPDDGSSLINGGVTGSAEDFISVGETKALQAD